MSLPLSGLISLIVPGRPANEPSLMVIVSPVSKSTSAGIGVRAVAPRAPLVAPAPAFTGASATWTMLFSISNASLKRSGVGLCALPTKPVTPGVWRTSDHDSSFRSMRTST